MKFEFVLCDWLQQADGLGRDYKYTAVNQEGLVVVSYAVDGAMKTKTYEELDVQDNIKNGYWVVIK